MKINVIFFGQLTDITGTAAVTVEDINDTSSLLEHLNKTYPALANSKYIIAVDKKVIAENTKLTDHSTVALMPPFSGG